VGRQQLNDKADFSFNSGQCGRSTIVPVQRHKYAIYLHTLFMKYTNVSDYLTASSFRVRVFYLKDGGSRFIINAGKFTPAYMASCFKRL